MELAVVVFALSLLATLLLSSAKAYLRGSDRASCIVNIQNVQKGVRGFANQSGLDPGATFSGLESKVVGDKQLIGELPDCPASGSYSLGGDRVPDLGALYMNCSLEATCDHVPAQDLGW